MWSCHVPLLCLFSLYVPAILLLALKGRCIKTNIAGNALDLGNFQWLYVKNIVASASRSYSVAKVHSYDRDSDSGLHTSLVG